MKKGKAVGNLAFTGFICNMKIKWLKYVTRYKVNDELSFHFIFRFVASSPSHE